MAATELMPPPDVVRPPVRSAGSWGFIAAAVILLAAHLPLLILHGEQIWLRPHYQFFPLAVLGAIVLAVTRLRGYGPLKPGSLRYALPLLTIAWLLLAAAELLYSSWLGTVAALVTLTTVLFAAGERTARSEVAAVAGAARPHHPSAV